jgi:hypothetical protein
MAEKSPLRLTKRQSITEFREKSRSTEVVSGKDFRGITGRNTDKMRGISVFVPCQTDDIDYYSTMSDAQRERRNPSPDRAMNANEMTFGVEIECTLPRTAMGRVSVGQYHVGTQIAELPTGWTAQRDGSLYAGRGRFAVEIVSPVLKGADGMQQLVQAVRWINSIGGSVNSTCGLHIHVGWNADKAALVRLMTIVANHEKGIYASTGTKTRERNHYCRGVQNDQRVRNEFSHNGTCRQDSRYAVLNTTNLGRRQNTVEFRAFAGTLNIAKIAGYVQMCVGLVQKAIDAKKVIKWVPKVTAESSPIKKAGPGQTELNRLLFALGWNKGRVNRVFGEIDRVEGCPARDTIKRKLMELATKYDSQP